MSAPPESEGFRSPERPELPEVVRSPEVEPKAPPHEEAPGTQESRESSPDLRFPGTAVEPPTQTPEEVTRQFLQETRSKHQKALTEYRLLFTRWKRQPKARINNNFSFPDFDPTDGADELRWEFAFPTAEQTVWVPVYNFLKEYFDEAMEEIDAGKFAFANITLKTIDEFLERGLAKNRELRADLVRLENPPDSPPPKEFVGSTIDLSEYDNVKNLSTLENAGATNVGSVRGRGDDRGRGRGGMGPPRGARRPSYQSDRDNRSRDPSRGRNDSRPRRDSYLGGRDFRSRSPSRARDDRPNNHLVQRRNSYRGGRGDSRRDQSRGSDPYPGRRNSHGGGGGGRRDTSRSRRDNQRSDDLFAAPRQGRR